MGGTSLYSFSKLAENNFRLKDALCLYLMMFTDKNLKNKLLKKYDYLNDGCEKLSGITDNNVEKYVSEKELVSRVYYDSSGIRKTPDVSLPALCSRMKSCLLRLHRRF